MTRKLIQDIVVNNKKSIKLIRKDGVKKPQTQEFVVEEKETVSRQFFPEKKVFFDEDVELEEVSKNSHMFLWIISIASVATLLFLFSMFFATAAITITPKKEVVSLNDIYSMSLNKNNPGLHYAISSSTKIISKSLVPDGEEDVERKAIGKAIIYNNFSTANQRLINNTRLEASDGSIYRIRSSVDVPGIKTVNGVKTPGSVEVEIIADIAGDKYNMQISDFKGDFKIPGFKGSTKYTGFYGRLSADVTGGFIGTVKKVSDDKVTAGREELKTTLKTDLIKDIYTQVGADNIILKGDYFIEYNDLADSSDDAGYTISESATIYAVEFNKEELATFIAKNKIKNFDNSKVDILWNDNALTTISGATGRPWTESALKVNFIGTASVVWMYDTPEILNQIQGQNKSVLKDILDKNKTSIVQIEARIRPQWKSTFPTNVDKIKVIDSVRDSI